MDAGLAHRAHLLAVDGEIRRPRTLVAVRQDLEDARLVTTRKVGREKFHYLNPVPIRRIHDRWITKYAQPVAAAMVGLRNQLEDHTA